MSRDRVGDGAGRRAAAEELSDVGRGQPGEPGEAALEHGPHEAAGDHHVRVGEPVADLPAVSFGIDDAGCAKDREVL